MAVAQRVVRVFYRDYVNDVSIRSTEPESLLAERLVPLAERLLGSVDNFLGVVDGRDTILQCYVGDDPETLVLELVRPEQRGCLRAVMSRSDGLACLRRLPERFDEDLLPEARRVD
jgi:hypothetical protein